MRYFQLASIVAGMASAVALQTQPPRTPPAGAAQAQTQAQAGAQQAPGPMPGPAIRVLGAPLAVSSDTLMNVVNVRPLPGGRVLVNDGTLRRILLLDSTMKLIKVVADSNTSSQNAYGLRAGRLLPYRGDSSLLVDPSAYAMLVIDGNGDIVRVKAVPRTDHATYYGGTTPSYGFPGFDAQGRLIYRIFDPGGMLTIAPGGGIISAPPPDSAPVLRLDFSARKYDTVGKVRVQQRITETFQTGEGFVSSRTQTNPMPVQDDWAVTSDGAVAFLRHRDYSLDWLHPDGTRSSTPPMPFEWTRLTDDHKKAFVDSVRTVLEDSRLRSMARYDSINGVCFNLEPAAPAEAVAEMRAREAAARGGAGRVMAAGGTTVITDGRGAAPPPPAGRAGAAGAAPPTSATGAAAGAPGAAGPTARPANCPPTPYPTMSMFGAMQSVIPYTALPDYKPPFAANSMRGDEDGNLWIRVNQMRPVAGTYLYDIVNRKGELFDRIQLPIARTVVGYAPGNIVYTTSRGPGGLVLERVRWR